MGRKTKLTPEIQETICNWLKLGYYQEDAAIMAGIAPSTYYDWLKKGAEEDSRQDEIKALGDESSPLPAIIEGSDIELVYVFSEFSEAVARARAEAEGAHIKNIRRAADNGTWQASAWFLERSFPKKWGKRSTLDIDAQGDEPIKFQISYGD
jgi:transposase